MKLKLKCYKYLVERQHVRLNSLTWVLHPTASYPKDTVEWRALNNQKVSFNIRNSKKTLVRSSNKISIHRNSNPSFNKTLVLRDSSNYNALALAKSGNESLQVVKPEHLKYVRLSKKLYSVPQLNNISDFKFINATKSLRVLLNVTGKFFILGVFMKGFSKRCESNT